MNRATNVYLMLSEEYPNAKCELLYDTPFQLLISTILSGQSTDKSVNNLTKDLYKECPDLDSLSKLSIEELEEKIRKIGLYKNKSKSIYKLCKELIALYDGEVPKTMEELIILSGVGRKTASVVLAEAFKIPTFPVDTHVYRVTKRLGLSKSNTVDKVSDDMMKKLPKKYWINAHHLFITHGRKICSSRNPKCDICILKKICNYSTDD
ncbi:endonuclease III [Sedimentibacter sp. zth1]|uniref:endonuclease III n=1 Tax=Sedimentibacter sp. zth1 TaxID=2816908 RepID=UPI001A90FD97|nr:endonuclease III [Sedimentibacter sp. zth1]QSX06217.1 endonuclease III [Sedimentibacter sp. zth1]